MRAYIFINAKFLHSFTFPSVFFILIPAFLSFFFFGLVVPACYNSLAKFHSSWDTKGDNGNTLEP